MTDWTTGYVRANGIEICYHRTGGDRPALVLAHGFGDNGLCWTRVARALEREFDIVMFDARNHGGSARVPAGPGDLADDLAGVIDGLGLRQPALMGHSMGAQNAAERASRHPGLVSRLVLEDPPWMARAPEGGIAAATREGLRRWLSTLSALSIEEIATQGRQANPEWHPDEFPDWASAKQQVDGIEMLDIAPGPWQSIAARIECPTLLLYAERARGGIVDDSIARQAREVNPNIRTHQITGAGHNIRREQFAAFLDLVGAFLRGGAVAAAEVVAGTD